MDEVKNKAVTMVAALLEAREDKANDEVVRGKLAEMLDPGVLTNFVNSTIQCVDKITAETTGLDPASLMEEIEAHVSSMVCVQTILNELSMIKKYRQALDAIAEKAEQREEEEAEGEEGAAVQQARMAGSRWLQRQRRQYQRHRRNHQGPRPPCP